MTLSHHRSALQNQKRKRGRPRKLSGSSNGNDFEDEPQGAGGPEEMLEVKMGGDGYSGNEGSDENTNRDDDSNNVSDPRLSWPAFGD